MSLLAAETDDKLCCFKKFNTKTVFQDIDCHYKNKTILRPSHGNSYTGKIASLYWNEPLVSSNPGMFEKTLNLKSGDSELEKPMDFSLNFSNLLCKVLVFGFEI